MGLVGVRVSVKIHTVYNKLLQTVNKRCVSVLVVGCFCCELLLGKVVLRTEWSGATLRRVVSESCWPTSAPGVMLATVVSTSDVTSDNAAAYA